MLLDKVGHETEAQRVCGVAYRTLLYWVLNVDTIGKDLVNLLAKESVVLLVGEWVTLEHFLEIDMLSRRRLDNIDWVI